jgi:hypothetical protein
MTNHHAVWRNTRQLAREVFASDSSIEFRQHHQDSQNIVLGITQPASAGWNNVRLT